MGTPPFVMKQKTFLRSRWPVNTSFPAAVVLDSGKELLQLILVLFSRTLLALGCHVGISDEHAEEKVKKMKLPKK